MPSRTAALPPVRTTSYRDGFGNPSIRMIAPAGRIRLEARGVVRDSGAPDEAAPTAAQHDVHDLPEE
jgi:hypothetical protein